MTATDLTVIMPAYDTEQYIGEAIASVLDHADRLLELIVVDDGSTDDTAAIAQTFGDRVRVLAENGGPAAARNTGIAAASTPYIGFLDSDDIWVADRPDPRLAALDTDPTLAGAFGHGRFFVPSDGGRRTPVLDPIMCAEMGTLIVRRETLDAVAGFDESFALGEDMDLLTRIREAGLRIDPLDALVFVARLRPGSLTRDRDAVLRAWMQAGRAAMRRERERERAHTTEPVADA